MAPSSVQFETKGCVQTNEDAPVKFAKTNGIVKDVDHSNFGNPIDNKRPATRDQYLEAIDAIRSKLPKLAELKALIELDLTSRHPPIFIDARGPPKILDNSIDEPTVRLRTRPETVLHIIEGLMEVRYADHFNHIEAKGERVELAVKFGDLLSPVRPASPSLPVGKLPEPTTDIRQVKQDLKEFGYGFVKDALSPAECVALAKRLGNQAAGERKAGVAYFDGGPLKPNQRIWNLPNKGQEFLDLLDHPLVAEFMPENLGNGYHLSSYTANINRPGSKGMGMHHDQITINPAIPQFPLGVNLMWFLEEVTEENGGTRILPRSHKGLVAPSNLHDIGGTFVNIPFLFRACRERLLIISD